MSSLGSKNFDSQVSMGLFVLLLFYVLATSKVISGWGQHGQFDCIKLDS